MDVAAATHQFVRGITVGGLRYALIAGICFALLYLVERDARQRFKIQPTFPEARSVWREVGWSVSTVLVFAVIETVLYHHPWLKAHSALYWDPAAYGWWYFAAAFPLLFVLHDAYFYWTHRLMHTRWLYAWVHATHHRSSNPTPWAAYSVHPLEAVINVGILVLIVLWVPTHPVHILVFTLGMVLHNIYGHTGFEVLPRGLQRVPGLRWINTSVAHNLHHQDGRHHFAFYFTFWDWLMGTMRDDYVARYEEVSVRRGGVAEHPSV